MIATDIFRPEQWNNFFLLVGTGAVTLTGLVFVAMSLNLKTIASDITHRNRAIGTLTGLGAVFMRATLALMGNQSYKAVGVELIVICSFAAIIYVGGYIRAIRTTNGPSLSRTVTGTALYLAEIIGAAILVSGHSVGMYIAATAMVTNTCYMITGAWLLVMGIQQDSHR